MTDPNTVQMKAPLNDLDKRRDFLIVATTTVGAVGIGLAVWPFIDSMNPSADILAVSTTELDLEPIEVGQRITIVWQGKPVFIEYRSPEQISMARADDTVPLIDPETDFERVQKSEWLVVIGICTHLGCIPLGQKTAERRGEFGGWFCPCHGSHYDASGRIRKGPAPRNLDIPPYRFMDDFSILIG